MYVYVEIARSLRRILTNELRVLKIILGVYGGVCGSRTSLETDGYGLIVAHRNVHREPWIR